MNDGQSLFSQTILDYLQTYTNPALINFQPECLLREFTQHWNSHNTYLSSNKKQISIQLLDISAQVTQKQHHILQHQTELTMLRNASDQLIHKIDVRQTELIVLEKRQSNKKMVNLSTPINELSEGLEICQETFDTVKSELKANYKTIEQERNLSQQLKLAYNDLKKTDELNRQQIQELQLESQLNTKKLIKSLNIVVDMRQMISNQRQSAGGNNSLSLNVDDTKQIQSLIEKLETVQLPTDQQFDHKLLENLQEILELKEQIAKNRLELPLQIEQIEELQTCDRTFSTPRFQSSLRHKAIDVLPNIRVRTEAEEQFDFGCGKRVATDCGYYDEEEEYDDHTSQSNLKAPWQSKKSLNFERNRKKKLSYISVASFSSQTSSNQKQLNLQEELCYLEEINEYYYAKKIPDQKGCIAPPQSPMEQSTTDSENGQKQNNSVGGSLFQQIAKIGIGIGFGLLCYKLFK